MDTRAGSTVAPVTALPSASRRLVMADVDAILDALPFTACSLDRLPSSPAARVGLRVDLCGRGRASREALLKSLRRRRLPALVLVEPLASGLGYPLEGRFIAADDALGNLSGELTGFPVGLLARPGFAIAHAVASPCRLWSDACDAFARAGLRVQGTGTPIGRDNGSLLSALWVYRAAGRLTMEAWLERLDMFPIQSFEWLYETLDGRFLPLLDGIETLETDTSTLPSPRFTADWLVHTAISVKRRLRPVGMQLMHSSPLGWLWIAQDGCERELDTADAIEHIRATEGPIGVVIDASHIAPALQPDPVGRVRRELPWPFHAWCALASDVDWSTHRHVESQIQSVCDEHALPYAASAYLHSRSRRWPAWDDDAGGIISQWCMEGLLDTVHGLVHSYDTLLLAQSVSTTTPLRIALDAERLAGRRALIVEFEGRMADAPSVSWEFHDVRSPASFKAISSPTADGNVLLIIRVDTDEQPIALWLTPLAAKLTIARITALTASRDDFATACEKLAERATHAPVFTAHGGGEDVARWGQLWSDYGLSIFPENRPWALDHPGSPFYAWPALRRAGVRFFNPLDLLFGHDATPISALLEPRRAQNDEHYYAFRRHLHSDPALSTTHSVRAFAKHAATAPALSTVIGALLQTFHAAPSGTGAIVYTHLGNRVGNQLSPRLGWGEDIHAALDALAEHYHALDQESALPFRVWVCTPATALAYAATLRGIDSHLHVDGNSVRIESWHDAALGHAIPDVTRFGGAWLHGLTVYVDDPMLSCVTIDGTVYRDLTLNRPDETGRPSISLVDARDAQPLIEGDSLALESDGSSVSRRVAVNASLRNVTHWRLEFAFTGDAMWEICLRSAAGGTIACIDSHESCRAHLAESGRSQWRVFPLFDGPHSQRKLGRVTEIDMLLHGSGSLRITRIDLLRPRAGTEFLKAR